MRHAAFLGIQVSTTKKISKRDGWRDGEDRKNGRWAGQQDKEPAAAAIPAGYSAHGQRITCSGPLRRSQFERGQPQRSIWGHRAGRKGKGRGREKLRAAPQQQRIWSERRRERSPLVILWHMASPCLALHMPRPRRREGVARHVSPCHLMNLFPLVRYSHSLPF